MRIYYDHQLCSLQDAGGASRYHYELMRYFSGRSDVEIELFLGMNDTVYPYKELASARARVIGFGGPLRRGMLRYAINELLGNSIAPFRGGFDVYHPAHHRIMPLVRSRRIVVTHHDCTYERFPTFRHTKQVLRAKKALFARADAIICISESSRRDLLSFYGVDKAKTRVIYHGLPQLPRSAAAARELQKRLRRDYLLYVSGRFSYKNFTALLQAFGETGLYRCFDLLLLGGGPLTEEELQLISHLGLTDSIISVPTASDALLAESYAGAKLFVYPSLWEGFGLPPLEAMAAGCPVLACNIASLPEICRDAPFYFEPEDQASLTGALLHAVSDENARQRAIKRGREVAAGYTWEKCGAATLALYRDCQ